MSADLDTSITLRGKKEELFAMLKVLKSFEVEKYEQYRQKHDCGYLESVELTGNSEKRMLEKMTDADLQAFLLKAENEVSATAMGPWGVFSHPEDLGMFEAIAEVAPHAFFEGAISIVDRYTEIPELTPHILHEFVEKIIIYAATDPHSKVNRRQQVDIYYKGIGILEISKVFDTRHK